MRIRGVAYNTALIPVAAGVLYPFFGITFRPELAGLVFGNVCVSRRCMHLWSCKTPSIRLKHNHNLTVDGLKYNCGLFAWTLSLLM